MKQKEKLLRLRPFNMANFSSGAGYLAFIGIFLSWPFILPATFFVWAGFAIPMSLEKGQLNYHILVRRLNRILLPICIVFFGLLYRWLYFGFLSSYSFFRTDVTIVILSIWVSLFPTLGVFLLARLSAAILYKYDKDGLTKGSWFICLLGGAILLIIVGAVGTIVLGHLGILLF